MIVNHFKAHSNGLVDSRSVKRLRRRKAGGTSGFLVGNSEQDGSYQMDGLLPSTLQPRADSGTGRGRINIVDNSPSATCRSRFSPVDKYRKSTRLCVCGQMKNTGVDHVH